MTSKNRWMHELPMTTLPYLRRAASLASRDRSVCPATREVLEKWCQDWQETRGGDMGIGDIRRGGFPQMMLFLLGEDPFKHDNLYIIITYIYIYIQYIEIVGDS